MHWEAAGREAAGLAAAADPGEAEGWAAAAGWAAGEGWAVAGWVG